MTTFYFVRHGVTAHTGRRLTGWHPGVRLTEEGRAQAEAAAEYLSRRRLGALYASPIDRTRETAEAISSRSGVGIVTREGLGEVHYGRWNNRTLKSLVRTKLWEQVQSWPSAARFPDGETLLETQSRALAEIEKLRYEHPTGRVCCVSHGDVIKLIVAHYLGVHIDLFQRIVVNPGSISIVSIGDPGPFVYGLNHLPERPA